MTAKRKVWLGLVLTAAALVALTWPRRVAEFRVTPPVAPPPAALSVTAPDAAPAAVTAPSPARPAPLPATPLPPAPYAHAVVLAERETPPDADGISRRSQLLQRKDKYPYIRVEETRRHDPATGRAFTVGRVAMVADHILVRLQPGATETALQALNARHGASIRRRLKRSGHYLVAFDPFDIDTVPARAAAYAAAAGVADVAEPDFLVEAADNVPNDARYAEQWGLAKVRCPAAWDIETGRGGVVIGAIDSGVNDRHEDLAANMWVNPWENPTNGIDDDANGYIDDIRGWDFAYNDNDPSDPYVGHGTHTAGTAAAVGNNSNGVAGVSWHTKVMALKMLNDAGSGLTSDAIEALEYARAMRIKGIPVRVTNNSWGGGGYSGLLKDTIRATGDAGMLFVAAAGNYGWNNDTTPFYPATYDCANILSVAATTSTDGLAYFSHYGALTVDLGAPGVGILSTYKGANNSTYYSDSGTSMASPHVAGACALLWEAYPDATWEQIRAYIMAGVATNAALAGKTVSGGRLDVAGAMYAIQPTIEHTPLVNTTNSTDDHVIRATVTPRTFMAPGFPRLVWNTDGSTNAYTTNMLSLVTNDLYEITLPVRPLGGGVYYYIEARTAGGVTVTDPPGAPAQRHVFRVVEPLMLWVSGHPSDVGSVDPGYGLQHMPSGITVVASADLLAEVTAGHRYMCAGWHAIGSAPAAGQTNTVTFTLSKITGLEWQWQDQYTLTHSSTPAGLAAHVSWWAAGAPAQTVPAPDPLMVSSSEYRFAEWRIDGLRWPDGTNAAVNPAGSIVMTTARQAVAVYLPADEDSDGDGLPDWWERRYFGSLVPTVADDADEDGYRNDEELADGTDPRDPLSHPSPPHITHAPLSDPQGYPAPWTVTAVVTDNFNVAEAILHWRRVPQSWNQTPMTNNGPDLYAAAIPAPGGFGETYEYRIAAMDPAGYTDQTGTYRFDVVYPVLTLAPTNIAAVLRPGTSTNILVSLANGGNTSLTWTAEAGWFDSMENGSNGVTHSGANDAWHITTNRAYSGSHAWYCGNSTTRQYRNLMNTSLTLPPVTVGAGARLTFRHWARIEYDDDRRDDHYWDGGIVELSTNAGASFVQIAPVGGYPHRITPNPDSPFDDHTPCYGGRGDGWHAATFDLSAYAGRKAILRFRFGSDEYVVDEGWYIDDIAIIPAMSTNNWLSVQPLSGVLAPAGDSSVVTVRLHSVGIPTGDFPGVVRISADDPRHPTNDIPVQMWVRSPPTLVLRGAAQTSRDGSGRVTITNDLWDADGETCAMDIAFMTATGVWTSAWIGDGTGQWGPVSVHGDLSPQASGLSTASAGVPSTNRVTLEWMTLAGPLPLDTATTARVRARAWDGRFWSGAVTSALFLVDNEDPSTPTNLSFAAYTPGTWATNRSFALHWSAAGDGAGSGVAGYALGHGLTPLSHSNTVIDTVFTTGVETVSADGTSWWFDVRAVDAFGNTGPGAVLGPARVDTVPPDPAGTLITPATSPFGDYVVGASVTSHWSGMTDNLSGLTGYYYAWTNGGGTAGGLFTVDTTGVLAGSLSAATNTVYVWGRDAAGWIGAAAARPVLVLTGTNDFDHDHFTTDQESVAGTDASDPASRFVLHASPGAASPSGAVVMLEWSALSNRVYTLYGHTSLTDDAATWLPLPAVSNRPGIDGTMTHAEPVEPGAPRFYRLTVE